MITENLSTLKIHKLTDEQYERELKAGRIDENAIYVTPEVAGGDMKAFVYDPQGKETDIFAYIDEHSANKTEYSEIIMAAANWVDNTYSFEDTYPSEEYHISIEVAHTATITQFEAFGSAMICGSADSNIATAIGGAPTIDIPIIVKAVSK